MSEPFLGEIRLFANGYAPRNWMFCEGQILPINTNQALYSLLGNVYGGNGTTTFALPDYRGRVPVHVNPTIPLGTSSGEAFHQLTVNEMPRHTHLVSASSNPANAASPLNNAWAAADHQYAPADALVQMSGQSVSKTGGNQPHSNMQPYLALNYAIAVQGIYPSRN
ncbi:phage tail protein [Paenibacillus sp. DMB20]|uniref:phage tail protein n=1 Tax=Paenibacillus sp. DMB20 TaxID=1642570 RepID=UPI000628197B|nr:tail fiber protein [Paenibacillus sp. DMB20]KKO54594.1 tail collar protein [Paenibacillus sp. DMB20]